MSPQHLAHLVSHYENAIKNVVDRDPGKGGLREYVTAINRLQEALNYGESYKKSRNYVLNTGPVTVEDDL